MEFVTKQQPIVMKQLVLPLILILLLCSCASLKMDKRFIDGVYEASCGICNFDMTGDDCELAIRIEGKEYYVEGSTIDEHGNAHAEDGLCNTTRKARVRGTVKYSTFFATSFELIQE